jgi:N utilization substance protein A
MEKLGSKEIIYVIETIAQQKGITIDSIVAAVEDGLKIAARKKYGHELVVECHLDKKTGSMSIYNKLEIIDKKEDVEYFSSKKYIILNDAKKEMSKNKVRLFDEEKGLVVGNFIVIDLPNLDLNRLVVQIAKNEILKKIKDVERDKEYNEFVDKIGDIVNGTVKKIGIVNTVVDVDNFETLLTKSGSIPGEKFRVGDRVRVYVKEVKKEAKGAQIFVSRADNMFLAELFRQEVPEIYDGVIEIRGIARDPGSKAKIAVYSDSDTFDVVGACVGPRGVRVQAVTNELKGERIDVIKWSENPVEYIIKAISPSRPSKIIYDEENNSADIILTQDQLSLAIGRGGQNIKLASKLTGIKLKAMTDEDEKKKRREEFDNYTKQLMESLDVEEIIAQLLVAKNYNSIDDIANSSIEELSKIEGFDEDIAKEIYDRAVNMKNTQN